MTKAPQTKATDDDTPRKKKGTGTSIVVWALMAMLVLGLGGFGVTSFGGSQTTIGTVGDREITVGDYGRALQQEMSALSAQVGQTVNLQQALTFGLDAQVRQRLTATAALDHEAARIGLSAGDARVAREITEMDSFKGPAGTFDRETYRFTLERNDLTEVAYETSLREDLGRALLQGAVTGGFVSPAMLTDTLYAHISERRGFGLLRLTEQDLAAPPPLPTDEELQAWYTENVAAFTRPEARRITYVSLLPEDIADKMPMDDTALRRLYDERITEFVQPERRLVERLVYPDEAKAAEAKALLDSGVTFEELVAARGVTLDAIDLGDVSQADLGAAGDAVFALQGPGVVGPLPSDLGPALFRMNAVLAAQNITFDEARADLSVELATDAARRAIDEMIEDIDDRLASGASLEEIDSETDMTLQTIDFSEGVTEGIAGYPAFREAAEQAATGDFAEVIRLSDGGIVALRLDAIVPPAPIPLEEAREDVAEAWRQDAVGKALAGRAAQIKTEVEAGAALSTFGIVGSTAAATRSSTVENAPAGLVEQVFGMALGEVQLVQEPGFTGLVHLTDITPGAPDGPEAEALKSAIASQGQQALATDAFTLFTNALTQGAGISFDSAAINAVHAQMQ